MQRYQRLFVLFVAPVLILGSALATAQAVAPDADVFDAGFLILYALGLGAFWSVFFLLDRAS